MPLSFSPPNAPEAYADRLTLWNAVESAETRKNARVAREVILALPHELSDTQRISLARDMALYLVETYAVPVDVAIHLPVEGDGHDPRNHHAHLLFSTRELTPEGFGKKTRILDDKEDGPKQVELIRDVWEALANAALGAAGFEARIDKRSLEDQGVDRIPQNHVGKVATHSDEDEDQQEEKKKEDDEEETDTGKTGSGDTKALTPTAGAKETAPPKKTSQQPKDRVQARLNLKEEIKRLNEHRATFAPLPLKDQIKELNKIMDRLDGRVQRLKTLSEKTSLPERITKAIVGLFFKAKEASAVRTKDEAQRTFSAAEREAKAERQRARYGKEYRASLNERIHEMREQIQTVKVMEKECKRYKAFVELIERRVEAIRSGLKPPALPVRIEWRDTAVIHALQSKTFIEAKQVREKIPIEYRPTIKQEALTKPFKATLVNSVSPMAIDHATKPLKNAPVIVQAQKQSAAHSEPSESRKVWDIKLDDKGRAFLEKMQATAKTKWANEFVQPNSGFTVKFNHPTRIVTNEEVIQKVRVEAVYVRAKVPPEFRAYPYPYSKAEIPRSGLSQTWDKAAQAAPAKEMKKFSMKFNEASGKGAEKVPPELNLDKHI